MRLLPESGSLWTILVADSVGNLYTLDTGGYDGGIGDQTDVITEAGTTCDGTYGQIDVAAHDVG